MSSNTIMHVIPNVSMSNGHDGLEIIAMKNKFKPNELKIGQFILFINRAFNACKVLAANHVLIHYKHPKGHILNYKALKLIPEFYDGQDIGYTKALAQVIKEDYPHILERKVKAKKPKRKLQGKDF